MISSQLEYIFNQAIKKANTLKHEFVTIENILIELLNDEVIESLMNRVEAPTGKIQGELEAFLSDDDNFSILEDDEIEELADQQFANEHLREIAKENGIFYQPEISMALQRTMQRAALQVQSSGKKKILPIHLLMSLFGEKDNFGIYILKKHGVERENLVEYVAHSSDRPLTDLEESESGMSEEQSPQSFLDEYAQNLTEMAKSNELDPIIGRTDEINRALQILMRRKKNNPLLVGDSGVGKTALAQGIAQVLLREETPEKLKGIEVYSLDMVSLMAGTKFRGDFEERLKKVMKALGEVNANDGGTLLFIDEIHTIIGAGATGGGTLDASNLLKPALTEGAVRFMGSTTFDEYKKHFEKEAALNRRFQKIDVLEPSIEETLLILQGAKARFEEHHGVVYTDKLLESIVDLTQKHLSGKCQPDKSFDVLDEAGAFAQMKKGYVKGYEVSHDDIESIIALMARIPKKSVSSQEREKLKSLRDDLGLLIFGQDQAIERVVDAVMLSRSGLRNLEKPIASFLFVGPTGVGKTELAKQLAFSLGINFERFDMSEYSEKHSVAKLIGAPPGYVGHDEGGLLTGSVSKNPYGVLLLDEIEKAHQDIFNILLQVMDYGRLTDSNGKSVDFRNTIIIMTSNAGAADMEKGGIGLGNHAKISDHLLDKALKNFFTPEFRNRLDAIVPFSKLDSSIIDSIVKKFFLELENQLSASGHVLNYDNKIISWVASKGYDSVLGARPLARYIDEKIKKPLAKMILFNDREGLRNIYLDVVDDEVQLNWLDS